MLLKSDPKPPWFSPLTSATAFAMPTVLMLVIFKIPLEFWSNIPKGSVAPGKTWPIQISIHTSLVNSPDPQNLYSPPFTVPISGLTYSNPPAAAWAATASSAARSEKSRVTKQGILIITNKRFPHCPTSLSMKEPRNVARSSATMPNLCCKGKGACNTRKGLGHPRMIHIGDNSSLKVANHVSFASNLRMGWLGPFGFVFWWWKPWEEFVVVHFGDRPDHGRWAGNLRARDSGIC